MKLLLTLLLLSSALFAQAATGTITVATTVTAAAQQSATDTGAVSCVATPSANQVRVTCKVAGAVGFDGTYTVLPASTTATNAAVASYSFGNNTVTWLLYQPQSTGPITWQVAANGQMKQGQF